MASKKKEGYLRGEGEYSTSKAGYVGKDRITLRDDLDDSGNFVQKSRSFAKVVDDNSGLSAPVTRPGK